jgi:hypothetical protein
MSAPQVAGAVSQIPPWQVSPALQAFPAQHAWVTSPHRAGAPFPEHAATKSSTPSFAAKATFEDHGPYGIIPPETAGYQTMRRLTLSLSAMKMWPLPLTATPHE